MKFGFLFMTRVITTDNRNINSEKQIKGHVSEYDVRVHTVPSIFFAEEGAWGMVW